MFISRKVAEVTLAPYNIPHPHSIVEIWKSPQDSSCFSTPSLVATPPLPFSGMGRTNCGAPFRKTFNSSPQLKCSSNLIQPYQAIADAGAKCLVALYGGDCTEDTLHSLRYKKFVKTAIVAKVDLARLPPTEDGATLHAYRTYHQVQKWLGVEKATQWGSEVAPPYLLKFLSCGCKKGCSGGGCTCVKAGLKCSAFCKFCSGVSCHNVAELQIAEEGEDDVDNHVPIFQAESDNFEPPTKRSKWTILTKNKVLVMQVNMLNNSINNNINK